MSVRYSLIENKASDPIPLVEVDLRFLQTFKHANDIVISPLAGTQTYKLTADNVAGALALPSGVQLHIRPKIGLTNLFRLLSFVSKDDFGLDEMVDFEQEDGILDLLGKLFAREVSKVLKAGLRQEYSSQASNLSAIRGRVLFGAHIRRNAANPSKVYCAFSHRSADSIENKTLLAATQSLLRGGVCLKKTQDDLRSCLHLMPSEIELSDFSVQSISQIQIGGHNHFYRRSLFLAGLVLRSMAFSDSAGKITQPSFLINVADLFQDYVAEALKQFFENPSLAVLSQDKTPFDVEGTLSIQPDLIFREKGSRKVVIVADTKYKDIDLKTIKSGDAYQMLAYMVNKRCRTSVLIYPESMFRPVERDEVLTIRSDTGDFQIHVATVPLGNPKETAAAIHRMVDRIAAKKAS